MRQILSLSSFRKQADEPDPSISEFLADGSPGPEEDFDPQEPETLEEAGIAEAMLEALVCKLLFGVGDETGRGIARTLGTPGKPTLELLARLKNQQFIYYRDSANMGDFRYALTEAGPARSPTAALSGPPVIRRAPPRDPAHMAPSPARRTV